MAEADEILRARAVAAERALDEALKALDIATEAGDLRARHAAAILRGERSPGRPAIDDSKLLAEVEAVRPVEGDGAVAAVAFRHGVSARDVAAIERRLRRKIPRTK